MGAGCQQRLLVGWADYGGHLTALAEAVAASGTRYGCVYGVPRGGLPVAVFLSHQLGIPVLPGDMAIEDLREHEIRSGGRVLIAEDIVDTGRTADPYLAAGFDIAAVFLKRPIEKRLEPRFHVAAVDREVWVVFPYEKE